MVGVGIRYACQIYKKEISPALSTWLIFFTGTSLSFITYLVAEDKDFKSGVLNMADVIATFIIVLSIITWEHTYKIQFKPFEKKYLVGAAGIASFWFISSWFISSSAFLSNLLVQVLIFVGYFPTIQNLLVERRNTESFSVWSFVLLAAVIALYPAIVGGNILAAIYVGRTIIMVSIVLTIMSFFSFRQRKEEAYEQ